MVINNTNETSLSIEAQKGNDKAGTFISKDDATLIERKITKYEIA